MQDDRSIPGMTVEESQPCQKFKTPRRSLNNGQNVARRVSTRGYHRAGNNPLSLSGLVPRQTRPVRPCVCLSP